MSSMPWTTVEEEQKTVMAEAEGTAYVPLTDTLRLFAGWLLAWYGLVFLLGTYELQGKLPFEIPFLHALFVSPLILRFAFGTYLFLLCSSLHKAAGGGAIRGALFTIVGVSLMGLFHMYA